MSGLPYWDFSAYADTPIRLKREAEMRIDERIRRSIIFLGGVREDGEFVPYGTGFLVTVPLDSDSTFGYGYLVTAKHVLDAIASSNLSPAARQNQKDGTAHLAKIPSVEEWYVHPTIKNLDLAVVPAQLSRDLFDVVHCETRFFLTDEFIAEHDIGAGDEVFTVGLLTRHFGKSANIPIVRMGNVAAMPSEPIDMDQFGEHPAYLVESRSIGGLSGSPVYWPTPFFRFEHNEPGGYIKQMEGLMRTYLLGVNVGLFQTSAHADRMPGEQLPPEPLSFLDQMSAGIAVVLPIQRVQEILDQPKLVAQREEGTKRWSKRDTGFVPTSAASNRPKKQSPSSLETDGANPSHLEDFTSLLNAAATTKPKADRT